MLKPVTLIFCLSSFISSSAFSAVNTGATSIKEIYSYAVSGGGDMLIVPNDILPQCDGFWLDNSDPGFEGIMSVALSAYHASTPVILYAEESELFSASSKKFCKLRVLRLAAKN